MVKRNQVERHLSHSPLQTGQRADDRESEAIATLTWLSELARSEAEDMPEGLNGAARCNPPPVLDRFQLGPLLGIGAYGAVLRAFDAKLNRAVALKIAWPHVIFDPILGRRFVEEAQKSAAIVHSGIVRVYDSGRIGAAYFIALELIEGPNLGEWLKERRSVPFRIAADIVRRVAGAVHAAHELGVVHRDLKPSNILLRPCVGDDSFPYEPVVGDFGLARGTRGARKSRLTKPRDVVGTDGYMSPEQAAGQEAEAASDIFSLGIILYELVTGRRPFDGENDDQVRQRVRYTEPRPIQSWRKRIPRDLEAIILKCLEKAPGARYKTALHLADDLANFLDGRPVDANVPTPRQRLCKLIKRNPLPSAIVGIVCVGALLIAGLCGAWLRDRDLSSRQIAVADAAERQQRYASNLQHAAQAFRRGARREVLELLDECRSLAHDPVQRETEWDFLWALVNDSDRTLRGHDKSVHTVRFSPDGHLLVSGGEDGRVIIWDTRTWTKRSEIDDKVNEVNAVEISADGTLLAITGDDGRVVVHRIEDGAVVFDEVIVNGRVFALTWLGSSTRLAVGGEDAVLSIIDPAGHDHRRTIPLTASNDGIARDPLHPIEIQALAYLPMQKALAVAMSPGGLHVLGVATLTEVGRLNGESFAPNAICSVPLGPGYLAATHFSTVQIWNPDDGSLVAEFPTEYEPRSLRYSKATGILVAGLRNGEVQTWDVACVLAGAGPIGRRFIAHSGRAAMAEISSDGAWLATGGEDHCVRLWHRRLLGAPFDVPLDNKPLAVEFSPCGNYFAIVDAPADYLGRIAMCDAQTGKLLWTVRRAALADSPGRTGRQVTERQIVFDATGAVVACLGEESSIVERESDTGRVIRKYSLTIENEIDLCGYSPDGASLIIHEGGHGTHILKRAAGNRFDSLQDPSRTLVGIFPTRLGDLWLETGPAQRGLLRATPPSRGTIVLTGLSERVQRASVSRNGGYLAAAGIDGIICAWNLEHVGPPIKFIGHDGRIRKLHFSPDGHVILSHADNGTLHFWHLPTRGTSQARQP